MTSLSAQCVAALCVTLALCSMFTQAQVTPKNCSSESECGWQASCQNSACDCLANFTLHENGRDCRNDTCTTGDCLQCNSPDFCIKCISFISVSTGQCLDKCEGSAQMHGDDLVCEEAKDDDDDDDDGENVSIVIAVVAGVAAGAVLCIIVIIAVCVYIRKTRRKINLQSKNYTNGQMDTGHVKQYPAYDNHAYESEGQVGYRKAKVDPLEYVTELDKLRPHADTLMVLLSQVRSKTRAMDSSDARVPTYKGVIHQLCRVLVLLHKSDPVVSIPSDAMGLIQWAHQMLEDHREQQLSNSGGQVDFPITQISSVDLDFDNPNHPVYATPERSQDGSLHVAPQQGVATPYSTVPVPLTPNTQQRSHYGSNKRPGFATISRARSIPDSALIRALEADDAITNTFSAPQDQSSPVIYRKGGLKPEDFQNFLINSSGKRDVRSVFNQSREDAQHLSVDEPDSNLLNISSETIKIHVQDNTSNKFKMEDGPNQNPYSSSTRTFQADAEAETPSVKPQPPVKKNIITNPKAVKKTNSITGNSSKYAVPKTGYFANGHFYDPNPMPNPDTEVYAPGSNYSNGSNVMSTFLTDLPRSRSASSSIQSEDGDVDSENSGGDLDVFPFDPKDATEPVEV